MSKGPEFIRDPIHNFVQIEQDEIDIINSEVFQRLRRIKQLGPTFYIYPGATHSRFEHSLGTMDIGTKIFNSIVNKNNSANGFFKKYSKELTRFRKMLRIALLLHDVGHAPFSHAAEKDLMPKNINHENYTVKIIKETELKEIINKNFKNYNFNVDYILYLLTNNGKILNQILKNEKDPDVKFVLKILSKIINSDYDADKIDYLIRDSYYCGVQYGRFDYNRLINKIDFCGLSEDLEGINLAIQKGGTNSVEGLVLARYFMFEQVYFHKVRRVYDKILINFLKEYIKIFPNNVNEYLRLDDIYITNLMREKAFEKSGSQINWAKLFYFREHPKFFYEYVEETNNIQNPEFIFKIRRLIEDINKKDRFKDKIIVDQSDDLSIYNYQPYRVLGPNDPGTEKNILIVDEENKRKFRPIHVDSMVMRSLLNISKRTYRFYSFDKQLIKEIEENLNKN